MDHCCVLAGRVDLVGAGGGQIACVTIKMLTKYAFGVTLLALALLLVEGRAELTAHSINLQACSASTTRWWKETATDRVVNAGNRGGSLCLDTWNDAAGTVKACSCDHAGINPSGQKIAWWRNDSSLRWLSAPGGSAGGMLCLVQLETSHSVSLAPCGTGLVSNASAQWQWPSAENISCATPIQNRRSQLCLNVVTKPLPPPPPGPAPPSIPGAPTWEPNWNLTETMATYIEPRTPSPSWANLSHVYGLVGLDWLNANGIWWDQTPAGRNRTRCEAVSVENCRRLKAAGLAKRCMIYHNLELALEWEESQRSVMYDQRKASYFLRYSNGTICERCAAAALLLLCPGTTPANAWLVACDWNRSGRHQLWRPVFLESYQHKCEQLLCIFSGWLTLRQRS